jgi:ribosome maturation factor RimP
MKSSRNSPRSSQGTSGKKSAKKSSASSASLASLTKEGEYDEYEDYDTGNASNASAQASSDPAAVSFLVWLPASLRATVEALIAQSGAVLVDSVLRGSEARRVVELYVDLPTAAEGITLEQCGILSREIGDVLDAANVFKGAYRLDVSSPGVDRPLRFGWQFARNIGRLLAVELLNGASGKGRIGAVSEQTQTITLEPAKKLSKTAEKKLAQAQAAQIIASNASTTNGESNGENNGENLVLQMPVTISLAEIRRAVVELEF